MKKKVKLAFFRLLLSLVLLAVCAPFGQPTAMAGAPVGTIAYIATNQPDGDAIHLVEPDGSNDRVIYSTGKPTAQNISNISRVVWKPDATELAFASSAEDDCSALAQNIYAIRPDGEKYRRVTEPPACGANTGLPTGTVIVPVENYTNEMGPFTFYLQGAPGPIEIALAPGAATELKFTHVADFGNDNQMAIWAYGEVRGYYPNAWADVKPGQTVRTGVLEMRGGFEHWGFAWPNYLPDGSKIASVFNVTDLYTIASNNKKPGEIGDKLSIDMTMSAYYLAWGPTPSTADFFLFRGWVTGSDYRSKSPIMLGDLVTGKAYELLDVDPTYIGKSVLGITWLPDGSGFLYSLTELFSNYKFGANVWEYSFATNESRKVTNVPYGFARGIAVSPDGEKILFELQPSGESYDENPQTEIWMANRDGSDMGMVIEHGRSPAWSQQDVPTSFPEPVMLNLFLPLVRR